MGLDFMGCRDFHCWAFESSSGLEIRPSYLHQASNCPFFGPVLRSLYLQNPHLISFSPLHSSTPFSRTETLQKHASLTLSLPPPPPMECTKFLTLHAHIPTSHEPQRFSLLPRCRRRRRRCRFVVPTYSLFSKTKTTSIPHIEPTPSSPPPLNSQSSSQPSCSFPFSSLPNHACQPFAIMLFSIALSFIPNPLSNLRAIAVPAMVTSQIVTRSKKEDASNDHEFSVYTKRLLKVVPILQERIREVTEEKGDMGLIKEALKGVREKRKEIQKEIMGSLMKELGRLGDEKAEYLKKEKAVLEEALPVRKELSKLVWREKARSGGSKGEVAVKDREKIEELERRLEELERDFNVLTEKAEELDQRIERRERFAFSVGIREILFVERECEELVEKLNRWLEQKEMERYNCSVVPHLSVW